ncbi:MAG: hypothetical protein ACUVXJ_12995, partial [Phycisphaerae bacterium]
MLGFVWRGHAVSGRRSVLGTGRTGKGFHPGAKMAIGALAVLACPTPLLLLGSFRRAGFQR